MLIRSAFSRSDFKYQPGSVRQALLVALAGVMLNGATALYFTLQREEITWRQLEANLNQAGEFVNSKAAMQSDWQLSLEHVDVREIVKRGAENRRPLYRLQQDPAQKYLFYTEKGTPVWFGNDQQGQLLVRVGTNAAEYEFTIVE